METGRLGEVYRGSRRCGRRSLAAGLGRPEGAGRECEILNRKMAVERVEVFNGGSGSRT